MNFNAGMPPSCNQFISLLATRIRILLYLFEGIPDQIYRIYIHYMPMARVKSVRNGKRATCELSSDT